MAIWPFGKDRTAEATRLDDLQEALEAKRDLLDQREAELRRMHQSLLKRDVELTARELQVQKLLKEDVQRRQGPLGANYAEQADGWCEHCGRAATTTAYKIFWAETKRIRRRHLCSDECAYAMEDEQRGLVDGIDYAKKSLGVTS